MCGLWVVCSQFLDLVRCGMDHIDKPMIRWRQWHVRRAVGHEVISQYGEIRDGSVYHRGEGAIAVFRNDDVASPRIGLPKGPSLNLSDPFVDWERHPIARNDWVKNDIRLAKLLIHAI